MNMVERKESDIDISNWKVIFKTQPLEPFELALQI